VILKHYPFTQYVCLSRLLKNSPPKKKKSKLGSQAREEKNGCQSSVNDRRVQIMTVLSIFVLWTKKMACLHRF